MHHIWISCGGCYSQSLVLQLHDSLTDHLSGSQCVVDSSLLCPHRSLLQSVVELLQQIQRKVSSEPVTVEPDLPGESSVLHLLDVTKNFLSI